jgi:hypothetical protein
MVVLSEVELRRLNAFSDLLALRLEQFHCHARFEASQIINQCILRIRRYDLIAFRKNEVPRGVTFPPGD